MKKQCKIKGGAPPAAGGGKLCGDTSGTVVILHFAVLEEVIPWVSLHFSIFSVGAPPIS